ncbi:hypothetical protein ABFS82_14G158200 [Erythranthe guttata]
MGHFMSLVIILSILCSPFLSTTYSLTVLNTESDGFTVDLIHMDSLVSPFYHINKTLQRSKIRADRFSFSSFASGVPSSVVIASEGDYIMKVNLGVPPKEINLNLDTGSLPLLDPKKSSTYKTVPGDSKDCKSFGGRPSILGDNTCRYSLRYLNTSYSDGTISSDTLQLNSTSGSPILHKNFLFGCGYVNKGTFSVDMCGVIGLGRGPGSFLTQMNPTIRGKFAYCLLPRDDFNSSRSSKIHFGGKAAVSGSGAVSISMHFFKSQYAARFKGISVGNQKLAMSVNLLNSSKIFGLLNKRIVVDSGPTLSFLPKKIYNALVAAMRKEIKLERADSVNEMLQVCYKTPPDGKLKGIPVVTVHFVGGDVKLSPLNTFLNVNFFRDGYKSVHCLAFVPHDGVAILGNLAQTNFLVISFKQTDCSKQ